MSDEKVVVGSGNGSATLTTGNVNESHQNPRASSEGLQVESRFCPTQGDPFSTVNWTKRNAAIKDENGNALFEQTDCEIPESWSQLATNVIVSKYFYGELGTSEREVSVRQVIHRVTRTIADWGIDDGYFATEQDGERFYRELTWLCLHQFGAFNSPVWFNVGLFHQYGVKGSQGNHRWDTQNQCVVRPDTPYEFPQASACFIQSVKDNMEDIMRLATSEAMLFKFGSGTGTDLSTIRSHREKLSGGGHPSGPLSFMRVYDQIAAVVKSGGKTRRAAKMQSLKDWHPDILEFIEAKYKEEEKARTLIRAGYDSNFNGEAYSSILFQNANLSVRVSDAFLDAVENGEEWATHWVTNAAQSGPTYKARHVMRKISEGTWFCGDPGLQYESTINRWHTCPSSGRINASNPCSEYMFLDNTACNLASLNLMKFRQSDGSFDVSSFRSAARLFFIAQEILVDHASYPTALIAENSHKFRPLGLGYANLGSMIMAEGLPYDSEAARGLCGSITALLTGQAYLTSSHMAGKQGPFEGYTENRESMLHVMLMHRDSVNNISESCPEYLRRAAQEVWDECVDSGEKLGYRNAQATVLAPTGTIAFMMDCDTTGIEPDIALVKYKQLAGGGVLKIVNRTVPLALKKLGYDEATTDNIVAYIDEHDTVEGAPGLHPEHLDVFDCSFKPQNGSRSIGWDAHVTMMGAAQPFISGAISKTVNMPRESTVEDVEKAYLLGWKAGLKALAIYRDGSKESQPLNTKSTTDENASDRDRVSEVAGETISPALRRERLPETRRSLTHKFSVAGHEGYITVGLYNDGRPGELFVTMAKEGSTVGGLMDVLGTETSLCLQYGVPLEVLVNKFAHVRFEPSGWSKNQDIPIAKSVVDYIFRWLGMEFLDGYREANAPQRDTESTTETDTSSKTTPTVHKEGKPKGANGTLPSASQSSAADIRSARASSLAIAEGPSDMSVEFARFQTDAPPCDVCGSITVRHGNCYLCHNCGNSMGCS